MKTSKEITDELGIDARHYREGKQSCKCPKCSHTRKKKNARCLAVNIDQEGVRWFCHHCNDMGGVYYHSEKKFEKVVQRKTLGVSDMRRLRT